jgi:hypothetical protein
MSQILYMNLDILSHCKKSSHHYLSIFTPSFLAPGLERLYFSILKKL